VDLTSFTDVAQHAVYDDSIGPMAGDDFRELHDRALDGWLLIFDTAADGDIHLALYVDEPLPDGLTSAVVHETREVLLRVPTGKLVASGLEYVGHAKPNAKSTVELPAGNYLVDIYERDVDWDRDVAPTVERELGPAYKREGWVGPLGGVLVFAGITVVVIALFAWSLLSFGIGMLVGALGIAMLVLGLPKGDYERQKRAIAMRFPTDVLVLRRLPDDVDVASYRGAVIGPP
jgi:hypothetical protein